MIRAMRAASSGMVSQQLLVDTIANNIANVNTTGFKKNRLAFRDLLYRTEREPGATTSGNLVNPTGLQVGSGTEISSSVKIFAQGDLEPTSGELDLAIQGEGFFRISLGNGEFRYTRDGSFRRDGNGDVVTPDGFRLEPAINVPPDAISVIIGQDGTVEVTRAGSTAPQQVGQILLSRFANPAGLKAEGNNFYSETASSGTASEQVPGQIGAGFLRQKFRERSNVQIVDELIELIQAQRNYEVNTRTIRVSDEMMQQIGSLVQ